MAILNDFLSAWMRQAFQDCCPPEDLAAIATAPAANPDFGDYQCNAAMGLARRLRQAPREIAAAAMAGAPACPAVAKLECAGPGFINITLDDQWLATQIDLMAHDFERLGVPCPGAGRTVLLDYSSPNIAKPMHIGHIRSTVIGNALDRLHRFLGYRVLADNHLGDWGTQFGILIMGYRHFADQAALASAPVEELERLYVRSYEQARADHAWMDQCRAELVKLQAGDPENHRLWQQFVDLSMGEFDRIYRRLDVAFDLTRGESFYHEQLPGLIDTLVERGLARASEGALVAFLEEEKLPPCIVRKSDGAFNYAATDVATIVSRLQEFQPDRIIYVTDERQQLHFRQIFAIARRLGIEAELAHVWFGLMRLPEGTFSTRQGNVIKLERLLDEAEARALELVRQSSPAMPPAQQREVARAVGLGAVKYADLSQNPQSLVTFSWDKALALNGNSAPYLQYAHARIRSVLDKYQERHPDIRLDSQPILLGHPLERRLALHLLRFPEAVLQAAQLYRPSILADYLYELAGHYSSFYQNLPFLKEKAGRRESRVRLCALVASVLHRGLDLLGITAPDRI
ncbi:MAG: arginine--tRNA ligase [Kiritimatiellia bacterium]|nr:arginine--tRNA ligase [Lentisphaerota bacterium]